MIKYQEWAISFECESEKVPQMKSIIEGILGEFDLDPRQLTRENGSTKVNLYNCGIYTYRLYAALVDVKKNLVKEEVKNLSVKHSFPSALEEVII